MIPNKLKGVLFVLAGAMSYGVLATFVKLGGEEGFSTAELTFAQTFLGFLFLFVAYICLRLKGNTSSVHIPTKKNKLRLVAGGIPMGLSSVFYYLSLGYVEVSVGIVLLMQSVWMGTVVDMVINKRKPTASQFVAIVVVLVGTVLATSLQKTDVHLDVRGVFWGLLAALAYTFSMFTSNRIAIHNSTLSRSLYILMGALITVTLVWGYSLTQQFDVSVFWKWGLLLAIFGAVLPPLLFAKGMPLAGLGLGSILAAVELPVSVMMAHIFLHEQTDGLQWLGIVLILLAITLMNLSLFKRKRVLG
ncbi:drug/metabolite transporter (DMT)-like permease [Dysgonomonas sp. PH5-45]|uniref:EamA family transporter n=1 Tax=unclassified Dysgonomonas TaxID=2630389 RepID=UPI0024738320|nr:MULTISPECIES: DMT family transporter [unclassified Dysgonomonas]MDH6353728.1 drug/metabolite transporter (DMT)-like permease [Dysgonomonas sp. PH5-45]MDH6386631.1 drug/metabolite transporter (DMT)-like permease [Dysgonomonas sp. PH5-37]